MKFKFCGDGDCPLWALAGLNALSSLPTALFKDLVQHVLEQQPDDGIMELLKDTSLSSREECARAAAVVRWAVRGAWSCGAAGALARDLLLLGAPRHHAHVLADAADAHAHHYHQHVRRNGFMINKVTDVSITPAPEETIDTINLSLFIDDVFTGEKKKQDLLIDKSQAKSMLEELKKAYKRMEELDTETDIDKFDNDNRDT